MAQRLNYMQLIPAGTQHLLAMTKYEAEMSIGRQQIDLVNIRVSQMNGCAFCVDMHVKEAKIHGERDLRVHHVAIWRESPLFSERERAAFEWAEAVTKLGTHGVTDEVYNLAKAHFSEMEIAELTFVVGVINFWNRLAVTFRTVPGSADKIYGLDKAGLS
jgi:AhpD family alkylhydroperoxidase